MQHISASGSQTLPAWVGNRRGLEITFCLIPGSYEQERHLAPACLSASVPSAEYWLCFLEGGTAVICLPPHFPFSTSGCISLIHTHTHTHTHTHLYIYIYIYGRYMRIYFYIYGLHRRIYMHMAFIWVYIYICIYIYKMNDMFVLCACTIYIYVSTYIHEFCWMLFCTVTIHWEMALRKFIKVKNNCYALMLGF